jgi:hypothetical protein
VTDVALSQANAGLWAALVFIWLGASVIYRIAVGKPLFARTSQGSAFSERWTSGRAGNGILARMSTAKNCLHVQVDRQSLHIHPHFPITLGFVPEIYGMDHVVPLNAVRSAVILGGRHAQAVEVRYAVSGGEEQVLQLLLRNAEKFIHAVLGPKGAA